MGARAWAGNLGKIIRHHRKLAALSQLELAQLAGVGKTAVFDVEMGKPTVRLDTLLRILQALNIELCWRSPLKDGNDA
jgi:HTH-type transcriptional regulator / antitoxin HipB